MWLPFSWLNQKNTVLLEAAREIVEIGLVPLHRIMRRRRARDDTGDVRGGDAVLGKQRLDDVDRRLVHPDAAVGAPRQEPHLRPQHQRLQFESRP